MKLLCKILVVLIIAALLGGILFFINSIYGNPLSATLANRAIKQYAHQNYSSLDLEIGKPVYNFKNNSYVAKAMAKTSDDTRFSIYYFDGKVYRDSYESDVLEMANTLNRLSKEYSAVVKNIIDKELGYEDSTASVMYDKSEYEDIKDVLKLDMEFDRTLPLPAEITIGLKLKEGSLARIAEVLTDTHKTFIKNDCKFDKYSIFVENGGMLVIVNSVTPADIEDRELENLLKKAKDSDGAYGISVFIKGEK